MNVCWFRLRKVNKQNVPQTGAAILVCNHTNMMDVACVTSITKRQIYFMGKKELFSNKLLAKILKSMGTFPISRGDADISGIRTALKILKQGDLLCIFPEGTRNRDKKEPLLPLHEGVAMLALRGKAPIVPMWMNGGFAPWKRNTLTIGAQMDTSEYAELKRVDSAATKKLTDQIHDALLVVRDQANARG